MTKSLIWEEQQRALELSIQEWEQKLEDYMNYTCIRLGDIYCPLCMLNDACDTCIVAKDALERKGCHNTPYYKVTGLYSDNSKDEINPDIIEAIQEEIDFLKSLRDKDNTNV